MNIECLKDVITREFATLHRANVGGDHFSDDVGQAGSPLDAGVKRRRGPATASAAPAVKAI